MPYTDCFALFLLFKSPSHSLYVLHARLAPPLQVLFTNFSHRDEVYELLVYLWQNPPSYVTAAQPDEDAVDSGKLGEITIGRTTVGRGPGMTGSGSWGDPLASSSPSLSGPGGNPRAVSMYGAVPVNGSGATFGQPSYNTSLTSPGNPFGPSSSTSAVNGQMQAQAMAQQEARVDVEKAREALRLAYSTRDVTADTINKIEQQGQQLVRMEAHLDNMSSNLDQSEHLIKGMESVFYYIGNKMKKNGQAAPPVVDYGNRALKVERQQPPLDIEILCKNPDDSFTPALLRFHSLGFACVDTVTGKPLNPSYTWPYADVQQLVLRARHEHLDVKFTLSSAKERFRLMSSYIQLIVNEIIIRKPEANDISVVFEPGVKQFEYGNPALSKIPTTSRVAASSGFSRPEALGGQKTSALLSAQADQQTRDDLDEVDRHMDEVSRVVGDIGDMAQAMNHELGAQIDHIDRIDRKVTENNDRILVHTDRMNKLMS